jgi:putative ABC transport system permease protein
MTFWILINDFLHDLKTQKTRVFLTTFAITWGTISIVLMLAFGRGLKYRIMSSMQNAGNYIIRVYAGETSIKYQGLPIGRDIDLLKEDVNLILQSIPQCQEVSPTHGQWGVRLRYNDKSVSTYCEGVYPNFEYLRTFYPKKGGRFLNQQDIVDKRRVVYLGSGIAEELMGKEDPIGKQIEMDGVPFTVIGIMQKKMQMGMSNGPDDERAIIPFTTFESIYPRRSLRMIIVKPNKLTDSEFIKSELFRILGKKHRFDPHDDNALHFWDFVANLKEMNKVFTGIEIFLGVVGALTLLVAGIGIANIMYVVVKERTREIGIKIAVGAHAKHIISQFIFESLLIAIIGGIGGVVISALIINIINAIPVENQGLAFLGKPIMSKTVMIITAAILGFIGIFSGVFPARKAARLNPVEALRYE